MTSEMKAPPKAPRSIGEEIEAAAERARAVAARAAAEFAAELAGSPLDAIRWGENRLTEIAEAEPWAIIENRVREGLHGGWGEALLAVRRQVREGLERSFEWSSSPFAVAVTVARRNGAARWLRDTAILAALAEEGGR